MTLKQFFDTVKLARATVSIVQENDKGFIVKATMKHNEEDGTTTTEEILLNETSSDKVRIFKGLTALSNLLRDNKVYKFNVVMAENDIIKTDRPRTKK